VFRCESFLVAVLFIVCPGEVMEIEYLDVFDGQKVEMGVVPEGS
jgi:hypothetical protein